MGYSIFDETMVDMTWPDIEAAAKKGAIVLLPVGIIEEHGPHMGLAVDLYIPYLISVLAKHELENRGTDSLITPPYYWGVSASTGTFAGTFSMRRDTMKAAIYDILSSLHSWKLDKVFVINWHAEYHHCLAVLDAVREVRRDTGTDALCLIVASDLQRLRLTGEENYILVQESVPWPGKPGPYVDLHAGSLETAIMVKYFPENVNMELVKNLKDSGLTYDDLQGLGKSDEATRELIPHGYFGNPAAYDTGAAEKFIKAYSAAVADAVYNYLKRK